MKSVHVAVAVIQRSNGEICISKRADHQHQGGLWEFPGGKVEADEDITEALDRELHEELGIRVLAHRPLIEIHFEYPDKHVFLDVHIVHEFTGEAHGREGQPVQWVPLTELENYQFPAANKGILEALLLPHQVVIRNITDTSIQRVIDNALKKNAFLYLRGLKSLDGLASLSDATMRKLLLPFVHFTDQDMAGVKGFNGFWHLTSKELMEVTTLPEGFRYSASCHNKDEVMKANTLGIDFIFIAPVLDTQSHSDTQPLGWNQFGELVRQAHMPVFALGGLSPEDLQQAFHYRAQGVAGISAF